MIRRQGCGWNENLSGYGGKEIKLAFRDRDEFKPGAEQTGRN
jgi:hypothetical protein